MINIVTTSTSELTQGSSAWKAARCGIVTASRVADILAKTRLGPAASCTNYEAQLIAERLTGKPSESYTNAAMRWGIDTEPRARAAYEFETDNQVVEVGFVKHPRIANFGCSPDGLIATEGLIEIKCPQTATHINTLLSQKVPGKYVTQMQAQMACTDRQWCDFVSFDPRLPFDMQLFIKRIDRDDERIHEMEKEVVLFLDQLFSKIKELKSRFQ